jgi:hypothetical protein
MNIQFKSVTLGFTNGFGCAVSAWATGEDVLLVCGKHGRSTAKAIILHVPLYPHFIRGAFFRIVAIPLGINA